MGIKITKGADLSMQIRNVGNKTTRAVRRITEQGADEMARVASEMAPEMTGALAGDIDVINVRESNRRVTRVIGHINPPKYAVYMHESVYNLGPLSLEKQARSPYRVGRKYLERAANYIEFQWGIYERYDRAIRKNLK